MLKTPGRPRTVPAPHSWASSGRNAGTWRRYFVYRSAPEPWALNSTPENRALRNLLTQKLGSAPARRLLATHFPQGSASAHIDNLKSQSRDDDHTSAVNKLAAELIARHGYLQG
ncbi:hypothetical protein ACLBOM_36610 [Escherichia coli]